MSNANPLLGCAMSDGSRCSGEDIIVIIQAAMGEEAPVATKVVVN